MIKIYKFERKQEGYTLLVVEARDFQPLDIVRIKDSYPEVDGTKGVVIGGSPELDITVAGDLLSHYRNRSIWQGGYNHLLKGVLVSNAFGGSGRAVGEVIPAQLPCLECCRELGIDNLIRSGAIYPYCEKHYHKSPHRSGSRRRKKPTT